MNDTSSSDTHESASLATTPSVAEVDGWEVESSSAVQPTNEELADRLREDPVSAPASADAPEPVDEDHDDAVTDDDAAPATPETPKRKKLTAAERKAVLQAEFNALTKQREDARRAFEAEEADRQRRRTTREQAPPADATPRTPAEASKATPEDGEPDWDKYEEEGKPFSQYQKDHAAWLRKVITAEAEARANRTAEERISAERERAMAIAEVARQETRVEAARAKYPDFTEKINDNLGDVPQTPFMAAVVKHHPMGMDLLYHLADHPAEAKILATLPMTRPMMDVVKASPDPTPLLSYWANHPEEHDRIAHLDPVSALLALGRLAAELSGPGAKTGSPGRTPPVTSAKPPIRPLGATRSAAAASRDDDDDEPFGPAYVKRELERQRQRA
jgi:hypothetical protein